MTTPDMSDGQAQALSEVREMEAAAPEALSLVTTPAKMNELLRLDLSLRTASLKRASQGLPLRGRERFAVLVPTDFPFDRPTVWTPHTRFSGHPHVQWSRYLCLYQAPDVEWDPADGMFGFIERLWKWLEKGALDELDPVGGALHPPATYPQAGASYYVIPRVDTPAVGRVPWTGYACLRAVRERRADVVGWTDDLFPDELSNLVAAAVLLAEPMPWEFPTRMSDLLDALSVRGVSRDRLLLILQAAAWQNGEGEPLYVLTGTPMRGTRGSDLKQHLTAWRLGETFVEGLRLIAQKYSDDEKHRKIGEKVEGVLLEWANKANVAWCRVLEDRPEIVTRRDHVSPMSFVRGKTVAIWGCGALGGHVALHLARAGATRIILRDNAVVTPGVLVRQPYEDADIGRPKAEVLAKKLRAIRPAGQLDVDSLISNVLTTALEGDSWSDDADIVFDCTASRSVRLKLEKVWRDDSSLRVPVVSMIVDRDATRGLVVASTTQHSGCVADVYRRAKVDACRTQRLRAFANAFYPPSSDTELFQPEPGCSSPTFVGSSADASALAATMLNTAVADLARHGRGDDDFDEKRRTALAHFVSQPHAARAVSGGDQNASFSYADDTILEDPRRGYQVCLSQRAQKQMQRWVEKSRDMAGPEVETGGLLFGERNDAAGVIWVTEVIGPPSDSDARPDLFECGTVGTLAAHRSRKRWSRGSVCYVGMWHTHPVSAPVPSPTDFLGMQKILQEGVVNPSKSLLVILGTPHDEPHLGAYVFDRDDIQNARGGLSAPARTTRLSGASVAGERRPNIGLALSGGGSRAIAFHLGCLRALHTHGLLSEVGVISAVSGGAVLAAMYAYSDDPFDVFDTNVCALLRRGLQGDIAKAMLKPPHLARAAATSLLAGTAAKSAQLLRGVLSVGHGLLARSSRAERPAYLSRIAPPLPRWASRTTAFESALRERLFGDAIIRLPRRRDLEVVLNATELRTGTAFRFGSRATACSRFGTVDEKVHVATAVAASAAYPAFLPALHEQFTFRRGGRTTTERVILTDGGVYENLGASCLDPARDPNHTDHVYPCDRLICCNAGHGQWDGSSVPYGWTSRMRQTVDAMFRKGQDRAVSRLFALRASGDIEALMLPYLGMRDESLLRDAVMPSLPDGFVKREKVIGYPTDFRAMSGTDLYRLTQRGEQLTRVLIEAYWSD